MATQPALVYRLPIQAAFASLKIYEQLYAHQLSTACWHGSRISMRQTSPESLDIFALIIELHRACDGRWDEYVALYGVTKEEVAAWVDYSARFLSNLGNYCGRSGEKFVPSISKESLQSMASVSTAATERLENVLEPMFDTAPLREGYLESLTDDDHAKETKRMCAILDGVKRDKKLRHPAQDAPTDILKGNLENGTRGSPREIPEDEAWASDDASAVQPRFDFVGSEIPKKWLGCVGIEDRDETNKVFDLVRREQFSGQISWAFDSKDGLYGGEIKRPPFQAVHALAFCSSLAFEASVNVPPHIGIRKQWEFKKITYTNRLMADHSPANPCYFVPEDDKALYRHHIHMVRFITTVVRDVFGRQTPEEKQRMNTFGKLAPSLEACRATLISYYLMANKDLLSIFGYTDDSEITADDLLYTTYLHIGVQGLKALVYYNTQNQSWEKKYSQANFAILRYLLKDSEGILRITYDTSKSTLVVHVDRSKIVADSKIAFRRLLEHVHPWFIKKNVGEGKKNVDLRKEDDGECKRPADENIKNYQDLAVVDGEYEKWRLVVCATPDPEWRFVQANTSVEGEGLKEEPVDLKRIRVEVKVYEESNEGLIQSWVERAEMLGLIY